jgi:DNA-directed RNA polymerase specialized sigma24 family protein
MTFEEFAASRLPGLLRFAAVLTGDRALAEDLAQEVLIRALAPQGMAADPRGSRVRRGSSQRSRSRRRLRRT